MVQSLSHEIKQYLFVTANYWAFTLTDGALRMLVVLYFYQLGYQPLAIALLFLFYEAFGVVTNLVGGWLGARIGLNKTMMIGLGLQIIALSMLTVDDNLLTVFWVMLAQALSGIAKDLNKMSAKSSIKGLVAQDKQSQLFRWVALLTGSKNALKGVGFFLGAFLLSCLGFQGAMFAMAVALSVMFLLSLCALDKSLGKAKFKPKFTQVFSQDRNLNYLSLARLFLFASRDVWFVIAIPVYFVSHLKWQHEWIGVFMACWVIGYGIIQAIAPKLIHLEKNSDNLSGLLGVWGALLGVLMFVMLGSMNFMSENINQLENILVVGLLLFGAVFALNSSLHSYVIVAMAKADAVSMDVGFYYMANAMGRLIGTMLSGFIYQQYGLTACLFISGVMALVSTIFIRKVNI